jgi:UDP-2,4-diacetamido-2,4,6-trideoxy-beta-L-altropyranose hydrolase
MIGQRRLLLRANATKEIGIGHFMRCLALGQAWRAAGGEVTFAHNANAPDAAVARMTEEGFRIIAIDPDEDGSRTHDAARDVGAAWIALDGYSFGIDFQRRARAAARLLVVDDNAENGEYAAHVVVNQNLHAIDALYTRRLPDTDLLLGPRYALLRREFTGHELRTLRSSVRSVVVTMGGSDPRGLTPTIVGAVHEAFPNVDVTAIVGPAADVSNVDATVLRTVRDMAPLLASADLVVAGAGTTAWELAAVATPMALVVCAENQRAHARGLVERGAAVDCGAWDDLDVGRLTTSIRAAAAPDVRRELAARAHALCDGRGADRVAAALGARATP